MIVSREFTFRHANEIAGAFVILAAVLLVSGIFFTGRSQGWFAKRMSIHLVFDTPEGTFGLQEGAPVHVRNTAAGRVELLAPTEDGKIAATLRVREQYRTFITVDATARVKRKFGVAGDAFIDIVPGVGRLIEDGGYLRVIKDEELLEMAQRMLEDLQESLTPIFAHAETIISNTASILTRLDGGEGLAGALLSDGELRDYTKGILEQAEGVTRDVRGVVGQATDLLDNEVRLIAERTAVVQQELERAVFESRKVVEAFQRHWLIRRYVEQEESHFPVLSGGPYFDADKGVASDLADALLSARLADDAEKVVRAAYNLSIYARSVDEQALAESLLYEAVLAARRLDTVPAEVRLLQAEWLRISGRAEGARQMADEALAAGRDEGRRGRGITVQARLLLAQLAIDGGDTQAATDYLREVRRTRGDVLDDPLLQAAISGQEALIAFWEGRVTDAAVHYLAQADQMRSYAAYGPMVNALIAAADLYYNAGHVSQAAQTYLRAAESLAAQKSYERSAAVWQLAAAAGAKTEDILLVKRIEALRMRMGY